MDYHIIRAVASLRNMLSQMNEKRLEIGRLTKTATILMLAGTSKNSLPVAIVNRCIKEQNDDGGWKGIVDTMWNTRYLMDMDANKYQRQVSAGLKYLSENTTDGCLWGRSCRDMNRIPVSGMLLFLLPMLANSYRMAALEELWISEKDSLTYKAAYVLMAFSKNNYVPSCSSIINETIKWLIENQRCDGSFAPWKSHPVQSDVFCTGVSLVGLLQYKCDVSSMVYKNGLRWLQENQLPSGLWPFHEIEDGSAWGLWAMTGIDRVFHETR